MTNNISFKAQFIKPVFINRVKNQGNYNKCLASFVELNPRDIYDLKAIGHLNSEWGKAALYIKNIYQSMLIDSKDKEEKNNSKFYALTTQLTNLEELEPHNIQGIIEIMPTLSEHQDLYIPYLQVNPENTYSNTDKIYSKIGTVILDSIKKMFPKKKISVIAGEDSQKFYEQNNFNENHFGHFEYIPKESL